MIKTTRHILKADEVAFDAPLCLDLDPAVRPHEAEAPCTSAAPNVRIVENHPNGAVLEVTCACGQTTYIRCEYGTGNLSPAGQASV